MNIYEKKKIKYPFLTGKRNISSGARSPSSQLVLKDSTRVSGADQNHSTLGSRYATSDPMDEMGRVVNNLTANTNSNANTSNSNSIVVSVKSKKRSLSSDSCEEHLNKKVLTSQDNANIKDNKQSPNNPESQDNPQSQDNQQSQDNLQSQGNDQSMVNYTESNREAINNWMDHMYSVSKSVINPQEPRGETVAGTADILKNNNDMLIAATKEYSVMVEKANDTLNELNSLVALIRMSAKNDITIRMKEISPTVFTRGEYNSSLESLSELSNLSDLSSESSKASSTNSLPQQVGTTTLSPQQAENATLPIQQAENAISLPINPELASVNISTDVSDPFVGEGFASLYNHRSPDWATYSGEFRKDKFTYGNYEVDLSGPDTIDYHFVYDYVVDTIHYIDGLIGEYVEVNRLEFMLFDNDFNVDVTACDLYHEAIAVIDILSAIN